MVSHDKKARAWGFIYHPDSPDDLSVFDEIESMHVPCLLSPLHDSDVWTSVDAAKNPEHVAGALKNPTTTGCGFLMVGRERLRLLIYVMFSVVIARHMSSRFLLFPR